jgi:hypothetical protein
MDIKQLLESSNSYQTNRSTTLKLAEKWGKSGLLKGLSTEVDTNNMATLLENQAKRLVVEASATNSGGASFAAGSGEQWTGIALPLVRRVFGDIAAKEFVSVQPMNLPSGLVFFLDFKYGTAKKKFGTSDSIYGADSSDIRLTDTGSGLYGAGRFGYSINQTSSIISSTTSSVSFADVNYDSNFSGTASFSKVVVPIGSTNPDLEGARAFMVTGSNFTDADVLQQFTKVNGTNIEFIINNVTALTGTPHGLYYNVATQDNLRGDFEDAPAGSISIPEIDIKLESRAVTAKTRKLKAQWTPEFQQDLNAYQSVDAEAELTSMLSEYISMEIDLEILDMLIDGVQGSTTGYWSAKNNTFWNGSGFTTVSTDTVSGNLVGYYNTQGGWFSTLGTVLQGISNKIHKLTLRGGANFMVVSPEISTIIESIPGFASDSAGDSSKVQYNFGVEKIGALNSRYKVYKNPYMSENTILMGYKGTQFLETGAVFAPYIPLIMTPLVYDPDTFTPRKGIMTRYAKEMIRPEFYGKVLVHGLDTVGY